MRTKIFFSYMLVLLLAVQSKFSAAQDARSLLIKMNGQYERSESFSMSVEVEVFGNDQDSPDGVKYSGTMKKSKELYFSDLGGKKMLLNKKYCVIMDSESKTMLLRKAFSRPKSTDMSPEIMLDSMLLKNSKIKLRSKTGKISTIEIEPQGSMYKRIEVSIDTDSNILQQVVYEYKDNDDEPYSKIVITYSNVKLNAHIPAADFSEDQFFSYKNGKPVPSGKWAGYKLIDQTNFKYPGYDEE